MEKADSQQNSARLIRRAVQTINFLNERMMSNISGVVNFKKRHGKKLQLQISIRRDYGCSWFKTVLPNFPKTVVLSHKFCILHRNLQTIF